MRPVSFMEAEGAALSFSVVSVVEDVLQQHGFRSREIDLDSRKAEEAASRRNEAASWLRKMVGVVGAKDFPAEPSEEEFRVALRSGRILCNVLNKAHPGAVSKVVESPSDSALIPDGAALSAYQYFENVRNFLVAAQEVGLPTFEASDLEQGGKSARVVNCVLALKSYCEWKQTGGNGVWKFGGNVKPTTMVRTFVRKNSEPFTGSVSRSMSTNEVSFSASSSDHEHSKMPNPSLGMLVRAVLSDKKAEEVPVLVESVLSKVVEEFELRIAAQNELREKSSQAVTVSHASKSFVTSDFCDRKPREEENSKKKLISDEDVNNQQLKRQIFDRQQSDIQELKHCLHTTKANMEFMQRKSHEDFYSLRIYIHGLAHAASGYNQVLEENRKLYNQVQDLKGSIRVYCRVRPFLDAQSNYLSTVDHIGEGNITINTPSKSGKGLRSFSFNQVYGPSATQSEVFADTQPLIRSVLDGYNVCIFAYGQTGSGKTHTMSGPKELTEQNQGVNYRALRDLFLLSEQRKGTFRYDISVQMIEIYNEQVRDLLVTDGLNRKLDIRNSSQTGINVPDANLVPVSSTLDVINLMSLGQRNRVVGATALNDRSSRSHSCLTVHVQGRDLTSGNILRGCMHLVDLAGSERVDKSEVTGDRLKEAQHINKSLAALGDVIYSLAQKNPHVPYRNSKLTQLLQDSLGGQAKTLMFVHISPEQDAVGETISTLKFAERVATIELGAARVNKDTADVKELKEQISSLKAALARKEEEPEQIQCLSGIPERFRVKTTGELSPFGTNKKVGAALADQSIGRHPMGDVGNIEVQNNSSSRQKRQSFDLPELLGNSPTWPSIVSSPDQNYREDVGLSEWEDKVMVNSHGETFYPKYIHESSKVFPDQSYGMFMANNRFDVANTDDLDDLDAATTSDSSEADLLWQFNQAKLSNMVNGVGTTAKKLATKPAKSPETSKKVVPPVGPSPSRKPSTGVNNAPRLAGRQPVSGDGKRKTGSRRS